MSPHANASYQWNGSSILAGNPATGDSADFPDQFSYAAGADLAVNTRVTLALDLLGRYYINAERLAQETFHALDGEQHVPEHRLLAAIVQRAERIGGREGRTCAIACCSTAICSSRSTTTASATAWCR